MKCPSRIPLRIIGQSKGPHAEKRQRNRPEAVDNCQFLFHQDPCLCFDPLPLFCLETQSLSDDKTFNNISLSQRPKHVISTIKQPMGSANVDGGQPLVGPRLRDFCGS
jgi:hypothetical protein